MTDQLQCPECDVPMTLRQSRYGPFYGCTNWPACDVTVGTHKDGRPLGRPANKETKGWRMRAHEVFDRLWKDKHMRRKQAYSWMQKELELPEEEAHIGMMDLGTCRRLIEAVQEWYRRRGLVRP